MRNEKQDKNGQIKPSQQRAIAALLSTSTQRAAAEKAAVTERTLSRWLTEPAFTAALRAAEEQAIDVAVRQLVTVTSAAIGVIVHVLASETARDGTKLRAADLVLSNVIRLRELRNIEARISALEEKLR